MSLLGIQTVICRALLSHRFREAVRHAPEQACGPYDLTPGELAAIRALRFDDLAKNARYIDSLRLSQVRKRFPLTDRVVAGALAEPAAFYDGWLTALIHETNTHYENATSFRDYVWECVARGVSGLPRYLADLAVCEYHVCGVRDGWPAPGAPLPEARVFSGAEASHLDWKPARRHVVQTWSADHDVVDLCDRLAAREALAAVDPRPTHALVFQDPSAPGGVRLARVAPGSSRLLTACDGTRTVRAIVDQAVEGVATLQAPAARTEVLRTLEKLGARQWVSFVVDH